MRGVEDQAGVPHGSARHHFANQQGLVLCMVQRLLEGDLPRPGEAPQEQIARWLGSEVVLTRARYELAIAAMYDDVLAHELVRGRDRLITGLVDQHRINVAEAASLAASLDGLLLDALLRRCTADSIDSARLLARFQLQV